MAVDIAVVSDPREGTAAGVQFEVSGSAFGHDRTTAGVGIGRAVKIFMVGDFMTALISSIATVISAVNSCVRPIPRKGTTGEALRAGPGFSGKPLQ